MDSRIERFMEVAKARMSGEFNKNFGVWQKLYNDLRNALPEEDAEELERQWREFGREQQLLKWDENFLKAIEDEESMAQDMYLGSMYTDKTDSARYMEAQLKAQEAAMKQRQMIQLTGTTRGY